MEPKHFEKLKVWKVAHEISVLVYKITGSGPLSRDFPLKNQLRRASISVPSNIAEGYGRHSKKEFLKHLSIANGSVFEVRSQVLLAKDAGLITKDQAQKLSNMCLEVSGLIGGLRRSVKNSL
ncbi:MAG: four helix bundle protein [bacterium]|nr:four helix bundle protein [bacterium]MDT8396467.1 four helix bundle protein [bacterium]